MERKVEAWNWIFDVFGGGKKMNPKRGHVPGEEGRCTEAAGKIRKRKLKKKKKKERPLGMSGQIEVSSWMKA